MLKKNLEELPNHQGLNLFKKALFHFEDEPARGFRTERTRKFDEIFTKAKYDFIQSNAKTFKSLRHYNKNNKLS